MSKRLLLLVCLGTLLPLGCKKSSVEENPTAQLKGPSQQQMQNTYSTTAKTRGGGGMMGRPGMGAPYGGGAPYGSGMGR
jgi:hypothetical protein